MTMYVSDRKTVWRNWVWTTAKKRLSRRLNIKKANCLYLVGPKDLDRKVAIEKGFKNDNLIAIDRVEKNVESVRKNKNLAICGNLQDILVQWPENWPIDFIDADFCSGLDKSIFIDFLFCCLFGRAIKPGTQICVNMQRGRDESSNLIRDFIRENGIKCFMNAFPEKQEQVSSNNKKEYELFINILEDDLHRGKQFILYLLYFIRLALNKNKDLTKEYISKYTVNYLKKLDPIFYSYKQSLQQPYMDTVVFTKTASNEIGDNKQLYDDIDEGWCWWNIDESAKSKITAIRAVKTMKLQKK